MSFLPTFQDYEAIELLGAGGYGKVFRCSRKESTTTTSSNTTDNNAPPPYSDDSISANWRPKTVAIKMIQYGREPGKDKHLNWKQVEELFGGPLHVVPQQNNNNSSQQGNKKNNARAADLVAVGLEGLKEAAALQTTGAHPSLIRLESSFYSLTYKSLCLVEEFADGPMLGDIYSTCGALPEKAMTAVTIDMLHGLLHLHSCRILHRDIKPTNILTCTKTGLSKIADMGVSALRPQIGDYRKTYVGTAGFMAPEVSEQSNNNNNNNMNINININEPSSSAMPLPLPLPSQTNHNDTNTQGSPSPNNPSSPILGGAENNNNNNRGGRNFEQPQAAIALQQNNNNNLLLQLQQQQQQNAHQRHWGPMSARTANSLFYLGEGYNEAADLWSMGITLLEGAIGQVQAHQYVAKIIGFFSFDEEAASRKMISMGMPPPRNFDDAFHVNRKAMEVNMVTIFECSAAFTDLLLSMLDPIPSRRPSCLALLTQHPFCVNAMKSFALANPTNDNNNNLNQTSTTATEVTLNYVRNFNNAAMKDYRRAFIDCIARVPRKKADRGNNLINARDLGIVGNDGFLPTRPDAKPEEIEAAKLRIKKQVANTFRAPRSTAWAVPSSNIFATSASSSTSATPSILDVVCALDFASSASCGAKNFSIGQGETASLFTPVIQARTHHHQNENASSSSATQIIIPKVILANSDFTSPQDFQNASQRIQVWCGNNNNNNLLNQNQSQIPFGQLFQNLLSPSLDFALTRTARLDTWLDGVPLSIPPPKTNNSNINDDGDDENNTNNSKNANKKNNKKTMQIGHLVDEIVAMSNNNNNEIKTDDDDDEDENLDDTTNTTDSENPQAIFEDDSVQFYGGSAAAGRSSKPQQQQQDQQPLYFWPTSTSPEVNAMLMRQQQQQNNRANANNHNSSSSEVLLQKESDALQKLKQSFAECEALVPNFSEQFFSGLTEATAVDAGMCALVTHAFDRGQGHVTRHRDALIHGYSLQMANQQNMMNNHHQKEVINSIKNNNNIVSSPLMNTTHNNPTASLDQQVPHSGRHHPNNNNAFSPINMTTSLPPAMLTGRKSTRQNTPRMTDQNPNNNSQANLPDANNVNLNSTNNNLNLASILASNNNNNSSANNNNNNFSPSVSRNHLQLQQPNSSNEPSLQQPTTTTTNQQQPFSPRNPFSPNYNNLIAAGNNNNNQSTNLNNNNGMTINTSRRVAGSVQYVGQNASSSTYLPPSNFMTTTMMNGNNNINNNTNENQNDYLLYYSGGGGGGGMNQNKNNNNNNNQASAWLASRDAWNISVPASICTSLNVFSSMINNNNGNEINSNNNNYVDEMLQHQYQYFEMNPNNNLSSNNQIFNTQQQQQQNENSSSSKNANTKTSVTSSNDLTKTIKNKNCGNNSSSNSGFVSEGINQDGFVYASELLFGAEAQRYHSHVVKSMQNGRN